MTSIKHIVWFVLFCLISCSKPTALDLALGLAGGNREELKKVLFHYSLPQDSLKYKAACFFIENMPYYHYYTGDIVEGKLKQYEILSDKKQTPKEIVDSLSRCDSRYLAQLEPLYDIEKLDAEFLIKNIDWSFKVWEEQPWGKNVPFDSFCEFVLPYCIGDEDRIFWKENVYTRFNPMLDSIRKLPQADDPLFAARHVLEILAENPFYFTGQLIQTPHAGPRVIEWATGTLYAVKDTPMRLFTTIYIDNNREYRYFRYMGPDSSYCNVSEVTVYQTLEDREPLTGQIMGTPGCVENDGSHEYTNVFDGDPYTSFNYKDPSGGWAGLDFGNPTKISKIVYTPRNRDNFIRPGDRYELFHWEDRKWNSSGVQTAKTDSLIYNVAKGSLLYLKNYTRGKAERVFEYREGKQKLW